LDSDAIYDAPETFSDKGNSDGDASEAEDHEEDRREILLKEWTPRMEALPRPHVPAQPVSAERVCLESRAVESLHSDDEEE
jgi:hypothetical protein